MAVAADRRVGYSNGNLNFRVYRADGSSVSLQYGMFAGGNKWKHVAATFDGSMMRIYSDGIEVGARAMSGSLPSSTADLMIGQADEVVEPDHLIGRLDDVAVYSRALAPEEIKDHWERSGPETFIEGAPGAFTNSGSASFSFSSPDAAATSFECKLDSEAWAACVSPKAYANLGDGRHTFSARAKTAAGFVDVTPATHVWKVERLGLEASHTLRGDGAELRWFQHHGTGFTAYEVHRGDSATFTPSSTTLVAKITYQGTRTYRDRSAAPSRAYTYKLLVNGVVQGTRTVSLPPAGEVVKTLQPGPDDGKGAYGYDAWDCANHGASSKLSIGRFTNNGAVQRALLGFDLSGIPTTATLYSANLEVRNVYSPGTTVTARIHRVTTAWEEGDEEGACDSLGASWKYASGGVPWTTPGGDFDPLVVASKTQTAGQTVGTDTYDIKSLVGQWVGGSAPNHGMLFKLSDETPGTNKYVHYRSDDYTTDITHRPKLTVRSRDDTVDTTEPTIIPSGDLWDNRISEIDRYAKLNIRATDAGTGTRDIKTFVNGYEQPASASRTSACAGCELTLAWTLDYGDVDLAEDNVIEIRATDMNGNVASLAWPMLLESPASGSDPTLTADVSDADSATPVGTQAEGCSDPENYIPGVESCPTVTEDAPSSTITAQSRAASTALAPGGPGWGVADAKPEVFGMEGTKQLRPRIVRKIVPWDILRRTRIPVGESATYYCRPKEDNDPSRKVSVGRDTDALSEWEQWLKNAKAMADAQGRTVEVIVSFELTRRVAKVGCYLPTTKQYREAVSEFITRYKNGSADMPPVRSYSAWNEPNNTAQPTSWQRNRKAWKGRLRGPAQAGRYWVALRKVCSPPACKAVAAEFLDAVPGLFKRPAGIARSGRSTEGGSRARNPTTGHSICTGPDSRWV